MRAHSGFLLAATGLLALGGPVEAADLEAVYPSYKHPTHVEYPAYVAYPAHFEYPGAFDCLCRPPDPVFIVDQGPTYELTVKTRVYPYVGDPSWRYDGYYGYPAYRAYRPMGEHGYRPYGRGYRPYGYGAPPPYGVGPGYDPHRLGTREYHRRYGANPPGAKIISVPARHY